MDRHGGISRVGRIEWSTCSLFTWFGENSDGVSTSEIRLHLNTAAASSIFLRSVPRSIDKLRKLKVSNRSLSGEALLTLERRWAIVLQPEAYRSHLSTMLVICLYLRSLAIFVLSSRHYALHHAALDCTSLTIVPGEILHTSALRRTAGVAEIGEDCHVTNFTFLDFRYNFGQFGAKILWIERSILQFLARI